MMPLPPNRERELIRLADAFNGLDFSGLNPIQGMVRRWLRCSKATPMNWHDVETVLALALKRDPRSSFAASRRNLQGVRFKKITMRDQPDGSQIDEAVVEAR